MVSKNLSARYVMVCFGYVVIATLIIAIAITNQDYVNQTEKIISIISTK